ncbi:ABC transporter substrate-binding protein [Gryllotalpicola koreensis]|uniref:ABC transporter substrate-binding protein n=1 Tax=Gryllotalpicola koreensis TaxID=993086 RepID=A0ABP8A094_9MICO
MGTKTRARLFKAGLAVITAAATIAVVSGCTVQTKASTNSTSGASGSLLLGADNGTPTFTRNFNPFSPSTRIGAHYMYEPLQVVNSIDGTTTPFLATGDKFSDPKTVDYTIRSGVKWSDGTAFTPDDVVFTFDLIKKNPSLDTLGEWQHIDSISSSGNTVTFHLKSPDVPAATVIDQQIIVPKHIWSSVKNPLTWTNDNPVVTGPYVLGKFAPNEYTLTKNKNYWQADKVAAKTLVLPASNTQVDIVHKGYDWAYSYISDVKGTFVAADKQHNTYWFPPGGTIALYPNLTKAPFNNLDFRQGLSYALDRDKIADDAEQGYVKAAGQTGLLLPNQESWLDTSIPDKGAIKQDTTKALAAFEKAGYTQKGGKIVDASGKQLSLTITSPNGYTDWLRGLQALQSQLKAIGIEVTLNQPQPAAYTQALNAGNFDLALGSYGGTGSTFQDFNNLLNSSFATPIGTATSANFERFTDAKTDQLLTQLRSATTTDAQKQIVDQLQQTVYDQLPAIGLFYGGLWGLFSTKNFTNWPSASNPYAPPSTWTETALLILTNIKAAS